MERAMYDSSDLYDFDADIDDHERRKVGKALARHACIGRKQGAPDRAPRFRARRSDRRAAEDLTVYDAMCALASAVISCRGRPNPARRTTSPNATKVRSCERKLKHLDAQTTTA
jgi:hypothetical protein